MKKKNIPRLSVVSKGKKNSRKQKTGFYRYAIFNITFDSCSRSVCFVKICYKIATCWRKIYMRQTKNQQTNKMDFDITTALLPAESMFSFSFLSLSFYFSRSRFLFFCSFLLNFVCVHHNFCSRLACSRFFYEKKIGTYLCQQRCVFSPEYMCCTKQQATENLHICSNMN